MTTFISFIEFRSLADARAFSVFDAVPEREDGVLGVLPDGTPVRARYVWDDDNGVEWTLADIPPLRLAYSKKE